MGIFPDANFDTEADCSLQKRPIKDQRRAEHGRTAAHRGRLDEFLPSLERLGRPAYRRRALTTPVMRHTQDNCWVYSAFSHHISQIYHRSLEIVAVYMR